jgi:ketosteroid isomerase-like protein
MTTSDATRLIEAWAEAWSSPNGLEKLFSLFTDDCVYEDLATGTHTRGKEELKAFWRKKVSMGEAASRGWCKSFPGSANPAGRPLPALGRKGLKK